MVSFQEASNKTPAQTDRILYPCSQMPGTIFVMCPVTERHFPYTYHRFQLKMPRM